MATTWNIDAAHATVGFWLRVIGDLTIRDATREIALDAVTVDRGVAPWGNERIGFVAKRRAIARTSDSRGTLDGQAVNTAARRGRVVRA